MKKLRKIMLAIVALIILASVVFGIYRTSYAERAEVITWQMKEIVMNLEILVQMIF